MARFVRTQITERPPLGDEEQSEHLLPGLPDEITLKHIVTQLPWQDLHVLPSLSRGWRKAIRSREVYDARVCHHATETLVVVHHKVGPAYFFALYSIRNKVSYFLPSVPGLPASRVQFVALEGKIYVFGGVQCSTTGIDSEKVFVLDLVGQRQWKQCASIPEPGKYSGCGVVDGKIYVIEGFGEFGSLLGGPIQVYDPKENAWSRIIPKEITPMTCFGWNCEVATLGEELFVYNTRFPGKFGWIYHPVKNEWRNFDRKDMSGTIFVANGKIYALTLENVPLTPESTACKLVIHVFNMDSKSWTVVHSSTLANRYILPRCAIVEVDDELLALVQFVKSNWDISLGYLLSKEFGGENKEIMWETVKSSISFERELHSFPSMCTVEL